MTVKLTYTQVTFALQTLWCLVPFLVYQWFHHGADIFVDAEKSAPTVLPITVGLSFLTIAYVVSSVRDKQQIYHTELSLLTEKMKDISTFLVKSGYQDHPAFREIVVGSSHELFTKFLFKHLHHQRSAIRPVAEAAEEFQDRLKTALQDHQGLLISEINQVALSGGHFWYSVLDVLTSSRAPSDVLIIATNFCDPKMWANGENKDSLEAQREIISQGRLQNKNYNIVRFFCRTEGNFRKEEYTNVIKNQTELGIQVFLTSPGSISEQQYIDFVWIPVLALVVLWITDERLRVEPRSTPKTWVMLHLAQNSPLKRQLKQTLEHCLENVDRSENQTSATNEILELIRVNTK